LSDPEPPPSKVIKLSLFSVSKVVRLTTDTLDVVRAVRQEMPSASKTVARDFEQEFQLAEQALENALSNDLPNSNKLTQSKNRDID